MPRFWPTWSAIGVSFLLARLSFPRLILVGRIVGALFRRVDSEFSHTARRNLELCFPELRVIARERLIDRHFASLGMALMEISLAWWGTPETLNALVCVQGTEHLRAALARGRGVILITAHFTTLELAGRVLAAVCPTPLHFFNWPTRNEALAYALKYLRREFGGNPISPNDTPTIITALRRNECVWYAPDQADQTDSARMAATFGISAASNTLTSRLARSSGAAVLPYFLQRLPGSRGYVATIQPRLEGFPGPCVSADSECFNRIVEMQARLAPEQYLWIHRRFKGLSAEYPDYYR